MNDGPKFVLTINSSYEKFVESGRVKKELWKETNFENFDAVPLSETITCANNSKYRKKFYLICFMCIEKLICSSKIADKLTVICKIMLKNWLKWLSSIPKFHQKCLLKVHFHWDLFIVTSSGHHKRHGQSSY